MDFILDNKLSCLLYWFGWVQIFQFVMSIELVLSVGRVWSACNWVSASATSDGQQLSSAEMVKHVSQASSWHTYANIVAQALIFISSCCNPFIYYISSRNFRECLQYFFVLNKGVVLCAIK